MNRYQITAETQKGGKAKALANKTELYFDASAGRDETLPNPAELLLTALAACILKNVERYAEILHYPYQTARVSITGERSDRPPVMNEIHYVLEIDTDVEERHLNNWHKNIIKFGTISNTLARAVSLSGTVQYLNNQNE